jgi:hypothetical protein
MTDDNDNSGTNYPGSLANFARTKKTEKALKKTEKALKKTSKILVNEKVESNELRRENARLRAEAAAAAAPPPVKYPTLAKLRGLPAGSIERVMFVAQHQNEIATELDRERKEPA